jgi:signal transduction histidine kinase
LLIEDNGQGFDVKAKRKGIGLANIMSRAELYNGQAVIESSPGSGCTVLVIFSLS